VSGVTANDGLIRLQLEGEVGPFLRAIATAPVTDLTIEPAHLEEAFLEFYAEHDPDAPAAAPASPTPPAAPTTPR
jgi:hypothetical protein